MGERTRSWVSHPPASFWRRKFRSCILWAHVSTCPSFFLLTLSTTSNPQSLAQGTNYTEHTINALALLCLAPLISAHTCSIWCPCLITVSGPAWLSFLSTLCGETLRKHKSQNVLHSASYWKYHSGPSSTSHWMTWLWGSRAHMHTSYVHGKSVNIPEARLDLVGRGNRNATIECCRKTTLL